MINYSFFLPPRDSGWKKKGERFGTRPQIDKEQKLQDINTKSKHHTDSIHLLGFCEAQQHVEQTAMQMRRKNTRKGKRKERKCDFICALHDCGLNICRERERERAHAVFLSQSDCACVCAERVELIVTVKSCLRLCSCYTDKTMFL